MILVQSHYIQSKPSSEIVFIPQHLVDQRTELPIDFLSDRFPADQFAKCVPIHEVLRHNRSKALASVFPNLKLSRGRNPAIARIEPQHHFAQAHQVPATILFWFYIERGTHLILSHSPLRRGLVQDAAPAYG